AKHDTAAALERERPPADVNKTDRPGRRLEVLEHDRERPSPYRIDDLIGENARDPEAFDSGINRGLGGADDEPRMNRDRRVGPACRKSPSVRWHHAIDRDAIMSAKVGRTAGRTTLRKIVRA